MAEMNANGKAPRFKVTLNLSKYVAKPVEDGYYISEEARKILLSGPSPFEQLVETVPDVVPDEKQLETGGDMGEGALEDEEDEEDDEDEEKYVTVYKDKDLPPWMRQDGPQGSLRQTIETAQKELPAQPVLKPIMVIFDKDASGRVLPKEERILHRGRRAVIEETAPTGFKLNNHPLDHDNGQEWRDLLRRQLRLHHLWRADSGLVCSLQVLSAKSNGRKYTLFYAGDGSVTMDHAAFQDLARGGADITLWYTLCPHDIADVEEEEEEALIDQIKEWVGFEYHGFYGETRKWLQMTDDGS